MDRECTTYTFENGPFTITDIVIHEQSLGLELMTIIALSINSENGANFSTRRIVEEEEEGILVSLDMPVD